MIFVQALNLILVVLFGFLLVNILIKKSNFWEKVAVGYFAGTGLFTLILFLLNLVGVSFSRSHSFYVLGVLIIVSLIITLFTRGWKINHVPIFRYKFSETDLISKFLFILLILFFLSSLIYTLYWPIKDWDALTLYDMRGRIFAETGFMYPAFSIDRYYLAYPLYTSIAHAWVYLIGMRNPFFLYTLNYIFFISAFYSLVRGVTDRKVGLIIAFILASSLEIFLHSEAAYTNLPYAIFYSLGILYFYNYLTRKNFGSLAISSILVGLSTWVRSSEPFWITTILILFFLVVTKRAKLLHLLDHILIILCLKIPWSIFYNANNVQQSLGASNINIFSGLTIQLLMTRLLEVSRYLFANFIIKLNVIFVISILSILLAWGRKTAPKYFGAIILLNYFIVFGGTYVYSFIYPKWWLVGDSVSRMSLFFIPITLFFVAILLWDLYLQKAKR